MEPRPSLSARREQYRTPLLWLILASSAIVGAWSILRNPIGLLAILPAAAVCTWLLRERPEAAIREHDDAPEDGARLHELAAAFGSTAGSAGQLEGGIHELLGSARRLFRAEYAEILVLPVEEGLPAHRSHSTRAGEGMLQPGALEEGDRLTLEAVRRRGREPVVVTAASADPDLVQALAGRKLTNAIIGTLHASRGDLGLAIVGDLTTEEDEPGAADATIFGTFCGHASVVLENARLGQSLEELMELKERLHHQAFHDALTGLPNRVLFVERVAAALDRARSEEAEYGPTILLLDLDNFKVVNDTWGHAAGDDLLVWVADRLRHAIRPVDTPARLGGDEFGILLEDRSPEAGEIAAERISIGFAEPFSIHEHSVVARPSVGIAVAERGVTAEQLLRNADAAMYAAKADDVRHVAAYEAETHAATRRRRELSLQLDGAIGQHEIELRFQPVVSLNGGVIEAFESLVRWSHPTYGVMSPGDFLPVAETGSCGHWGSASCGRRAATRASGRTW